MTPDELQQLVDELAMRLKRSVEVDDSGLHFLVASKHFGDEDEVRIRVMLARRLDRDTAGYMFRQGISSAKDSPVLIPASPERSLKARRCFPIRWDGNLLGFLWLIDDGDDSGDEAAQECAHRMAMTLYGRTLRAEQEAAHVDALVRGLLSAEASVAEQAERDLCAEKRLPAGDSTCVLVVEPVDKRGQVKKGQIVDDLRHLRSRIGGARSTLPPHQLLAVPVGQRLAVVLTRPKSPAEDLASQLADVLVSAKHGEGERFVVGIGTAGPLRMAHLSYQQARLASRAAVALPRQGPIATWHGLGAWAQLLQLTAANASEMTLPSAVLELQAADRQGTLVRTAAVFLDAAGDTAKAALVLHIHRTTLYYRLTKIETATGLDLSDGQDRLTLHMGLKLLELTENDGYGSTTS